MGRDRDDADRRRHRSHKSKHHKDDRHRKSSRHNDDDDKRRGDARKLTAEEERLYETAKAFVERSKDRGEKHNKKSRRHGDDGSSSSSDDSRHHRKRHRKEGHKSDRRKDHKRSRKDHDNRDKKKSRHREETKHIDKPSIDTSKLISLGPITNTPPTEQLDPTLHYFSHNTHLRLYLFQTHGLYFEDLSSDSSRQYFTEFVDKYNSGKLPEAYYRDSLPVEAVEQCSRTKHQWKFRTNEMEEQTLNLVKVGVRKQTEYDAAAGANDATASTTVKSAPPFIPQRKTDTDEYDHKQSRAALKLSDKRHREQINLGNEEIYGVDNAKPSSGYERQQLKKREQADKTHGAHRDREDIMGGIDLDDDAIYGSDDIGGGGGKEGGFHEAVAKERGRRERREAEMARRVEDGKRKEEEKRKEMLAMLGLSGVDAGKKITIAPRRDGV